MKRSLEGEEERKKKPKIDYERDVLEKMKEKVFIHMELDLPYNFGIVSEHKILCEHLETEFNNTSDYKSKVKKKLVHQQESILYFIVHFTN
jgi:hypothetical protein